MNRLAKVAAAATLVALAGAAGAAGIWSTGPRDDGARSASTSPSDGASVDGHDRTGYGGYADAATAGQAYYGWRYPFAPPLAAALAAADEPTKTKSE